VSGSVAVSISVVTVPILIRPAAIAYHIAEV
jgi:hypothetical protein